MSSQEEAKLSDIQPQHQNYSQSAQWFWQSDKDPWKEKDPTKWNWTPYSSESSHQIEDAFSQSQATADLGDYEIDFKKMLQVNKKDRNKIRMVKRELNIVQQSRFMLELPKPVIIENSQQAEARLTTQHYSDFIMKRTQETYRMFKRLSELNLDSKRHEYQDVTQDVIKSIQNAAESYEKAVQARGLSNLKSSIEEAKQIIFDIETKSDNPDLRLRDFLKLVLRAYTMESFVCYWVNELLRSENWAEINVFAPYMVCLAYTFQVKDFVISYQGPRGFKETFSNLFKSKKLVLYHGTAITKEQLDSYRPDNTKQISWNGVISASKSKEHALSFARLALNKTKEKEKLGVLFKIEADFGPEAESVGMIDVSQDSLFPHEQEVLLAPGAVFEVLSSQLNQTSNVYEVKMGMRKKVKEVRNIIHGDRAKLSGLTYDDIVKGLELVEGNQLVEKLEIENCVMDYNLMELIDRTRQTTKIKKENVLLKDNHIIVDSLKTLCYYFSTKRLGPICRENNMTVKSDIFNSKDETMDLKVGLLDCQEQDMSSLLDKGLFSKFCNEIVRGLQFHILFLQFRNCKQFTDKDFDILIDALITVPSLQHLTIDFQRCELITDPGFDRLIKSIKPQTSLEYFTINFSCCNITDQGLDNFKDTLTSLGSLKSLHLDFIDCKKISDHGIAKICDAVQTRPSLHTLAFSFGVCPQISDRGLDKIKDAVKSMTLLSNLWLIFSDWEQLTDKDLDKVTDALKSQPSLEDLSLDLYGCKKISDIGIEKLKDGFQYLASLKHLNIRLGYNNIKDPALEKLADILSSLTKLSLITLELSHCEYLSKIAVDKFKSSLPDYPTKCIYYPWS